MNAILFSTDIKTSGKMHMSYINNEFKILQIPQFEIASRGYSRWVEVEGALQVSEFVQYTFPMAEKTVR